MPTVLAKMGWTEAAHATEMLSKFLSCRGEGRLWRENAAGEFQCDCTLQCVHGKLQEDTGVVLLVGMSQNLLSNPQRRWEAFKMRSPFGDQSKVPHCLYILVQGDPSMGGQSQRYQPRMLRTVLKRGRFELPSLSLGVG